MFFNYSKELAKKASSFLMFLRIIKIGGRKNEN
jgi:hypothetical protein